MEICSLNYKGVDIKKRVSFEVARSSSKRKEMFTKIEEIDKKEDYNTSSLPQKFLQTLIGKEEEDQNTSDEEEDKKKK